MTEPVQKGRQKIWAIILGLIPLAMVLIVPAPAGMPPPAWCTAGIALLLAIWWITEAIPIPAAALAPLVFFPLFSISSAKDTAAAYADPIIFLFLGGFIIGTGMQRWELHKRIGLGVILLTGTTPRALVGGFMFSTALLSMWVSNSATAIMMLPVAASVLTLLDYVMTDEKSRRNLGLALLLAVAYGANIGGLGTLIGTPPNAFLSAYISREHGIEIGFARWMMLGLPIVAIMLTGTWLILISLYPVTDPGSTGARPAIRTEIEKLGPLTSAEWRLIWIFGLTLLGWVTRPLYAEAIPGISDMTIAIMGALSLFLTPSGMPSGGRLLGWSDLSHLPWGILILFGGGLSLAAAIDSSGLAAWIGILMGVLADWPALATVALATVLMIFLTELTSNTASAATFIPIGGAIAVGIGLDPVVIAVPLAMAASCAFMLPVATPPNAIVFSSGRISIRQMAYSGLWVNLLASTAILALAYPLAGWIFGK